MKRRIQKNKGFTMIEMLISIAIVITSATIVVAIITATFRSSNDASSQEKLRQAGTGALSQATGMLRFADSFNGVVGIDSTPSPVCQTLDSDTSTAVQSVSFTLKGQAHTIACAPDSGALTVDDQPLMDSNSINSTCDMTCTQNTSADSPVITIDLGLSGFTSDETLQENNAGIANLSQSVRMANLNQ